MRPFKHVGFHVCHAEAEAEAKFLFRNLFLNLPDSKAYYSQLNTRS